VRIVTTRPLSQGTAGFKAKAAINISGGSIDSYNSSLGPYRRLDHAKVMTNSKATGLPSYAISISTAHIYGSVQTGDGGKVFCNTGTVGTTDWNDGNTGVQMSPEEHFTDDADMRFDNVPAPFTSGFNLVPGGTWGGTNVTYKLDTDGDYYYNAPLSPINLGAGKAMIVTGKVRLYTTGNFSVGGSGTSAGFVYIAPGASLELYVTGSFNAAGGGVINGTGATDKLTVYGVNTVLQNASYSGTSGFVGSMYMPNSALTLSGSTVAYGSFSASSIVVNGTTIHIDEALGGSPANGYVVISWNELAPNASLY